MKLDDVEGREWALQKAKIDRSKRNLLTDHFGIFDPSIFILQNRPLSNVHFLNDHLLRDITVHFCSKKIIHYRPGPSTMIQITVKLLSRSSTFRWTAHFHNIFKFIWPKERNCFNIMRIGYPLATSGWKIKLNNYLSNTNWTVYKVLWFFEEKIF